MKNLLSNPVFIGGVVPMIAFGIYNAMLKPLTARLSIDSILFGITVGIILTTLLYAFFWGEGNLVKDVKTPSFLWSIVVGMTWTIAVIAISTSLGKLGGNLAQIAPILNGAGLVSLIIAIVVFKEAVVIWKVFTGAALIFLGALFLI